MVVPEPVGPMLPLGPHRFRGPPPAGTLTSMEVAGRGPLVSRLGLRGRIAATFALGAFAAALALGVATYASMRGYLLDQRLDVAQRQAFNNAQLLRAVLAFDRGDVAGLIGNVRSERGGFAVLHLEATGTESAAFFAQEPLRFTQSNLPRELLDRVLGGESGRQRFSYGGRPYEAVGVAIPGIGASYFESFPLADVESTLLSVQSTLLVGVGLITFAAGALGFSVSRNVLRPLGRITLAAREIATGGLDTRLEPEGDPDLDRLVTSFNDMADSVQQMIQREQRFASDVSHELRSPVTALVAAVELLASRRDEFTERNVRAIDILLVQVRRFDRTVLDLLELARLDAGTTDSGLETLVLGELIGRIMSARGFADVVFHNLAGAVDEHGTRADEVLIDRRRVERILVNLLENARDHGGGATSVTLSVDGEVFRLVVEDSGPGVAVSERDLIFERFARGTAARSTSGSGLGLAIVAEHARALGGSVRVDDSPSGGARFLVVFKRTALPPENPA